MSSKEGCWGGGEAHWLFLGSMCWVRVLMCSEGGREAGRGGGVALRLTETVEVVHATYYVYSRESSIYCRIVVYIHLYVYLYLYLYCFCAPCDVVVVVFPVGFMDAQILIVVVALLAGPRVLCNVT